MSKHLEESANVATGEITCIHNCGSIVALTVTTDENCLVTAYFDHRCFGWMLQGEQCTAEDLIGRTASFDGEVLTLLD